ncbi:MAG: hypothetical protein RR614_12695 [Eubacterium sp.]
MNFYGVGRPIIKRPRDYMVEAGCKVRVGFRAYGEGDAEAQFYAFTQAVESAFPAIVFEEIAELYEDL